MNDGARTNDVRRVSTNRAEGEPLLARIEPNFRRLSMVERSGGGVAPHRHEEYEIILVESGIYRGAVGDTWLRLEAGEGLVVQPGDRHEDRFSDRLVYFGLCFTLGTDPARPAPPSILAADPPAESQRFHVPREAVWPLLRIIQREGAAPDALSAHVQDALLLAFFWQMIRALPAEAVNPRFLALSGDQAFPTQLLRLFRSHANRDLSVAEMAAHLHMSESSLAHKCSDLLGVSPRKAFQQCRMERAQYLLANSEMSVKEVAAELGFGDPYTFSRTFKTVCGVSPTHWLQNHPPSQGG